MTPFFRDTETDRLPGEVIEVGVEAKTEDMEDQDREDLLWFLNETDLQRKGNLNNPIDLHYWMELISSVFFSLYFGSPIDWTGKVVFTLLKLLTQINHCKPCLYHL